jgi:glycosyltransferase involved in cell wall biosynthesis
MNVCLLGDFSPELDEGYKNTSHVLAAHLEERHRVVRLNVKGARSAQFWREARSVRADIVHTIAQPTDASIVLTRLVRRLHGGSRSVISALRSDRYFEKDRVGRRQRSVLGLAAPDLVLVQNESAVRLFSAVGCRTRELPNGVDLQRFRPVCPEERRRLRAKYGLDEERPIVLHVGHLEPDRNLLSLRRLPSRGVQVVIAGSLYMGTHTALIAELERAGYRLFKGYQSHVEELYGLADLYVFPLRPGNSLTMPLSVLEAMACNLPVLTTRFSGLQHAFGSEYGLHFIDFTEDLTVEVEDTLAARGESRTREAVSPYSWTAVVERLETYYDELRTS